MYSPYSEMYHYERQQKDKYEGIGFKYKGMTAEKWPKLYIEWDLKPENFHHSLDGEDADSVSQNYKNGFSIGKASTKDIYGKLFSNCIVRDSNDFWAVCDKRKACGVLGRWKEKELITPPLIKPHNDTLIIVGGNHRFNVARLAGAEAITFITPTEYMDEINSIIPTVSWQID
ncbi:hypothetical protein JGC56_03460 [Salmonella enterica subsp. enterica serovar Saintpaul]|nr:hypothetical protein [Salmonella enterica subsp. enterica serovar Saintpaul]